MVYKTYDAINSQRTMYNTTNDYMMTAHELATIEAITDEIMEHIDSASSTHVDFSLFDLTDPLAHHVKNIHDHVQKGAKDAHKKNKKAINVTPKGGRKR